MLSDIVVGVGVTECDCFFGFYFSCFQPFSFPAAACSGNNLVRETGTLVADGFFLPFSMPYILACIRPLSVLQGIKVAVGSAP